MHSALNPEAPEFHPHLTSVTQGGYSKVNKTIRSSNALPSGVPYDHFKTFTDFNVVMCQLSENVVAQTNQIMVTELPAVRLKSKDIEYNTEKIIDANDSMLDRVNINIDSVSGINKPSDEFLKTIKPGVNVSSWNQSSPVIAKLQVGSATFIGAKNIPRPQLTFKDPIDNSTSLWVPKISDKPNNIKPLALSILYNDKGEAVGYEHPYQMELDLYHPPQEFIDPDLDCCSPPLPLAETKLTFVDSEQKVDELVKHLNGVKELAVDVENHSYRTYQGITCLIQITTEEGGDFIVDALAVREHVHKLNAAFTDPKKIKVFHGAELDIMWLQRDFGVYVVGLFDTHQAAKALKANGLSLKYLLMKYCGVDADKKYQLADWRIRPLPEELVSYARMDTHCLLYIWRRMRGELLAAAGGQPHLLLAVFEQSRLICAATYNKEVVDDNSHMALYVRSKKSFNSQQMTALRLLYKWRDSQARELDESTMYLLPNHMLLSLAENLPREIQGVNACCSPMPPFVKQNLITVHRMILSCRELTMEPQLYQMPQSIRTVMNTQVATYNVHDLSHLPDFREDHCINLDLAAEFLDNLYELQPDIPAFSVSPPTELKHPSRLVSTLNADAKLFIPPYDRYRKYRSLAQMEELKEYKEKEAKIAAIGKGNELIKTEVLIKIQQAKTNVENEDKKEKVDMKIDLKQVDTNTGQIQDQRKRKMPSAKVDVAEMKGSTVEITEKTGPKRNKQNKCAKNVKPYAYKQADYRKFYDDNTQPTHKQPKKKFRKHK